MWVRGRGFGDDTDTARRSSRARRSPPPSRPGQRLPTLAAALPKPGSVHLVIDPDAGRSCTPRGGAPAGRWPGGLRPRGPLSGRSPSHRSGRCAAAARPPAPRSPPDRPARAVLARPLRRRTDGGRRSSSCRPHRSPCARPARKSARAAYPPRHRRRRRNRGQPDRDGPTAGATASCGGSMPTGVADHAQRPRGRWRIWSGGAGRTWPRPAGSPAQTRSSRPWRERRTFRGEPATLDVGTGPFQVELSGAPLGRGEAAYSRVSAASA